MSHRVFGRFTLFYRVGFTALLNAALMLPAFALVSVRSVEFNEAFLPGQRDPYQEIAIHLRGERSTGGSEARGFHRDVTVKLELAYAVQSVQSDRIECYQAQAHLVGLAPRAEKTVYFFLPPEVVQRDRLNRPPAGWRVSLSVAGVALPNRPGSYSTNLSDPATAHAFLDRFQSEASGNEGILLPIYLTPFFADYHRRGEKSPAFKRVDGVSRESQGSVHR